MGPFQYPIISEHIEIQIFIIEAANASSREYEFEKRSQEKDWPRDLMEKCDKNIHYERNETYNSKMAERKVVVISPIVSHD